MPSTTLGLDLFLLLQHRHNHPEFNYIYLDAEAKKCFSAHRAAAKFSTKAVVNMSRLKETPFFALAKCLQQDKERWGSDFAALVNPWVSNNIDRRQVHK